MPWTIAYKVPLSTGFFRQEYWSGLPFPSPVLKVKKTHRWKLWWMWPDGWDSSWSLYREERDFTVPTLAPLRAEWIKSTLRVPSKYGWVPSKYGQVPGKMSQDRCIARFPRQQSPLALYYNKKSHVQMKKTVIKGERDRIWIKSTCEESLKRFLGGVWVVEDETATGAKLSSEFKRVILKCMFKTI